MIQRTIFLLTGLMMCTLLSTAQQAEKKPNKCSCSFRSIVQAGLVEGQAGASAVLQTIHGIRYKKWFAGLGTGLDYYHIRGIPVFVDIRRDILNRSNTPFVYADAGIHFPWARDKDKGSWYRSEFSNGVYLDLGLGYKVALRQNFALLFNLGYSYKEIEKKQFVTMYCLIPPCPENVSTYDYNLNRLSLKMGLQF